MSLIKLLNSNRNFFKLVFICLFFFQNIVAEEKSVDIWNNKNQTKPEKNNNQQELKQEPKIDISKLNQNQNELIENLQYLIIFHHSYRPILPFHRKKFLSQVFS